MLDFSKASAKVLTISETTKCFEKNFHFPLNFNIQKHFKSLFANRLIIIYIRTSGVCAGAQARKRMGAGIHAYVYLRPRNSIILLHPKPYNCIPNHIITVPTVSNVGTKYLLKGKLLFP